MEGEIPGAARSTRDYILRKKSATDAKPLCVAHTTNYWTHPNLLVMLSDTNTNDTDNSLYYDKSTTDNKNKTNA